jgi:hypothetical protein
LTITEKRRERIQFHTIRNIGAVVTLESSTFTRGQAVKIRRNGEVIATCYGSDILQMTAKEEARQFIEGYKKCFPKVIVNGLVVKES